MFPPRELLWSGKQRVISRKGMTFRGASAQFDVNHFANILHSELTGRSVGYQFTVGHGHGKVAARAGGIGRASERCDPGRHD